MPLKDPEARKAYVKAYAEKRRLELNAYRKEWKAANKDKMSEYDKKYKEKKGEAFALEQRLRTAKWREQNLEKVRAANRECAAKKRAQQPEKIKAAKKQYAQRNKAVINAAVARRKAAKLKRTPKWLTKFDKLKIQCVYSIAAMLTRVNNEPWHVDHVIPLQGDLVSGLHVPSNLQVMRGVENVRKHKKFEVVRG
tara:strand:+ start:255 stop:839 length:585 start_codon:yes stop_codon:yes gene_type:complete